SAVRLYTACSVYSGLVPMSPKTTPSAPTARAVLRSCLASAIPGDTNRVHHWPGGTVEAFSGREFPGADDGRAGVLVDTMGLGDLKRAEAGSFQRRPELGLG